MGTMRCEGRGEWVVVSFLSRCRDSRSFVASINRWLDDP